MVRADAAVPYLGGLQRLTDDEAVARAFLGQARAARAPVLDGAPGAAFLADGRLRGAPEFVVAEDRITAIDVISDPAVLAELDVVLSAD